MFCSVANYLLALQIERSSLHSGRRTYALTAGIIINLSILFFFKYFNFFADSLVDLAALFGAEVSRTTLNIVLPVGVSFFTFQALSYVIDVYRREIPAEARFLDVAFYKAFFPQLVAGPIVRAADFMPQMKSARRWRDVPATSCILLFVVGFIKKACISDNLAPVVDEVFAAPGTFRPEAVIAGVWLYAVQIYCDFSGYTDMAIATAGLLGYRFIKNFDAPYLASSITAFWRRWHMSLSSWLRDYLYIPLGGNRHGTWKHRRNLILTMLLGGLWHGASYNFVIWGFLHGSALVINGLLPKADHGARRMALSMSFLGALFTFWWVSLTWIFFRASDIGTALDMSRTYVTLQSAGTRSLDIPAWPILTGLLLIHWLSYRFRIVEAVQRLPLPVVAIGVGALAAVALGFVPTGYRPFIYFQF
jgi:D-alanyl-lipoteichoic acid acyltransferase DltB (MBOAT superfamily)